MIEPTQYGLGDLIDRLRDEPDQSKRLKIGFREAYSYRGYYNQVAFEAAANVTVAQMLTVAENALGATFHGYKGGEYTMLADTETWLVSAPNQAWGETLGAVMLDLMLANVVEESS